MESWWCVNGDYNKRHAKRDACLDESGIGHDVDDRFRTGFATIAAAVGTLSKNANTQLAHNLMVNVPCGIYTHQHDAARLALMSGFVATLGGLLEWDIAAAREFCAQLLEDVNDHSGAAIMYDMAGRMATGS